MFLNTQVEYLGKWFYNQPTITLVLFSNYSLPWPHPPSDKRWTCYNLILHLSFSQQYFMLFLINQMLHLNDSILEKSIFLWHQIQSVSLHCWCYYSTIKTLNLIFSDRIFYLLTMEKRDTRLCLMWDLWRVRVGSSRTFLFFWDAFGIWYCSFEIIYRCCLWRWPRNLTGARELMSKWKFILKQKKVANWYH